MSREIDERIVAMYFDNKNFESGAQQTLKTLDELKKSCNMEGVGKGFEAFENVSKKLNLDDLRKKTDRVKSSFEGLGSIIKKTFNLATSPLRAFKGEIDQLNGYIGKVFGIDLASKIVGNLENAFRSLTVAPISAGWKQYENTMDSVKTIMSSTGEDIDTVKAKLAEMTTYANQTIYSLNDMTSNLGKFTNNGVKLDDATNAMIGLANATADAGQGAAQASMAMYNVSQAIGVGKMTTIDWKSLENANIATKKLKQTFIDAAVAHGTLEKKVEKDAKSGEEVVKYYTKAEKGSKAMEVSVENFRETLNKGWLDKTAMMNTFAIFSGQLTADEIAALGFSKEESARLYQIGQEAMAAATEVRTFSKMMDALKESVQSGWATSFEYIFGDMEEGTNLWTAVNEKIDGILSKSTENRNNILMSWRGLMKDEDGQIRRIEDVYKNRQKALYDDRKAGRISEQTFLAKMAELDASIGDRALWVDYREVAIGAFSDIFEIVQEVAKAVKGAFTDVFGEFNADTLKNLTQGFRDFVSRIKNWLGDLGDADSRISKIRKGVAGIFNVVKLGINIFKTLFNIAWQMVKPIIDPLLNLFAKLGDWLQLDGAKNLGDMLKMLRDRFLSFWNTVKELGFSGVMAKIGQKLTSLWQTIKSGVRTFMYDNGLGGVYEWFAEIKEKFISGYEAVKEWWNDPSNGIANFFKSIYTTVTGWFKSGVDENGHETRSPIAQFFYRIKTEVDAAYKTVSEWWKGSGIPQFFSRIWNEVTRWFQPQLDFITYDSTGRHEYYKDSPIVSFFKNIWTGIQEAFEEIKGWWNDSGIPQFFKRMWNEVTSWFKPQLDLITYDSTGRHEYYKDSPVVSFFKNLWSGIQSVYEGFKQWWNDNDISGFFEGIWNAVSGVFKENPETGKAPIVEFFEGIASGLSEAWSAIDKFFTDNGIYQFFTDAWGWILKQLGGKDEGNENAKQSGRYEGWNLLAGGGVSDMPIGKKRAEIAADAKSAKDLPEEAEQVPIVKFFMDIVHWLEQAWTDVTTWKGWDDIASFFSDAWGWITNLFTKQRDTGKTPDVSTEEIEEKRTLLQTVVEFVSGVIEAVADAVTKIGTSEEAKKILDVLADIISTIATAFEKISDWLARLVRGEDKNGQKWNENVWDSLGPILAVVLIIGSKIIEWGRASALTQLSEAGGLMTNIGGQILKVGAGILLISFAIKYLGQMDPVELGKGAGIIAALGAILIGIMMKFTEFSNTLTHNAPVTSTERILGKVTSVLGTLGALWLVLDKLPTIIEKLSDAKLESGLNGDDILKTVLGVVSVIGTVIAAIAIFGALHVNSATVKASAYGALSVVAIVGILAIGMDAIIGTLLGLDQALENADKKTFGGLHSEHISRIQAGAENLKEIGKAIGGFFGALAGAFTGEKEAAVVGAEQGALEQLALVADKFDIETTSGITRILTMMTHVTELASKIDTTKINYFSTAMEDVSRGILSFRLLISGYMESLYDENNNIVGETWYQGIGMPGSETYEAFQGAIEMVKRTLDAFDGLGAFANSSGYKAGDQFDSATKHFMDFAKDPERLNGFVEALNAVIDSFGGLHDGSNVNFDGINIVQKLYDAIQIAFDNPSGDLPEFNATPIVDAIIKALGLGETAIAQAVHNMVQAGLNLLNSGGEYTLDDLTGNGSLVDTITNLFTGEGPLSNLFSFDGLLGGFEMPDVSGVTGSITKAAEEAGGEITASAEEANKSLNNMGLNFKISGFDLSSFTLDEDGDGVPDILKDLESNITEMQTAFDTNPDYQITIRPILDTTDFDTQMASFKELLGESMPVSMGAVIEIGNQPLPIDDKNIIAEIRMLRTDLQVAAANLQSVLYSVNGSVNSHIDSVTSAVTRLNLSGGRPTSLKDVDSGLYRSAKNAALTGVSTYEQTPHLIP